MCLRRKKRTQDRTNRPQGQYSYSQFQGTYSNQYQGQSSNGYQGQSSNGSQGQYQINGQWYGGNNQSPPGGNDGNGGGGDKKLLRFHPGIIAALGRAGIETIEQLANMTEREVLAIKGIGKKALEDIKDALDFEDLKLKE